MSQRKSQSRSKDTRAALLAAALQVIGEKGYTAATVDEIVERAGVSKGVAYYHFKNKAAMAESILIGEMDRLIAAFEPMARESAGAIECLGAMIECFASHIFENRNFGRFFVTELWRGGREWSQALNQRVSRILDLVQEQFRCGQQEGAIRPEIDPVFEAVAIIGMVSTTALYYVADEGVLARRQAQTAAGEDVAGEPGENAAAAAGEPAEGGAEADKQAFIRKLRDLVKHANAV